MKIKKLMQEGKESLDRHAGLIATVATIVGIGMTAILSAKAGAKAKEQIELAEEEKGQPLTTVEKVKTAAPCFVGAGIAASGAVTGSVINYRIGAKAVKVGANAVSALAATRQITDMYKSAAEESLDEDKLKEIKNKVGEKLLDQKTKEIPEEVKEPLIASQMYLVVDKNTGNTWYSTYDHLKSSERAWNVHCNKSSNGVNTLNNFYELENASTVGWGDEVGLLSPRAPFAADNDDGRPVDDEPLVLDIDCDMRNGVPCITIDYEMNILPESYL